MVAINALVISRFEVRDFEDNICKACVWHDFVIRDFVDPEGKKYPEKVISSKIQTNINLYMFRAEFLVKKNTFAEHWVFNFFPRNALTLRSY